MCPPDGWLALDLPICDEPGLCLKSASIRNRRGEPGKGLECYYSKLVRVSV